MNNISKFAPLIELIKEEMASLASPKTTWPFYVASLDQEGKPLCVLRSDGFVYSPFIELASARHIDDFKTVGFSEAPLKSLLGGLIAQMEKVDTDIDAPLESLLELVNYPVSIMVAPAKEEVMEGEMSFDDYFALIINQPSNGRMVQKDMGMCVSPRLPPTQVLELKQDIVVSRLEQTPEGGFAWVNTPILQKGEHVECVRGPFGLYYAKTEQGHVGLHPNLDVALQDASPKPRVKSQ